MPSIHIPEDTWTQLLMQHNGDRAATTKAAQDAVRERVEANDE